MKKLYIGIDIGCIECGEDSGVVAVSHEQEFVQKALDKAEKKQAKDWHGEHHFELFKVEGLTNKPI